MKNNQHINSIRIRKASGDEQLFDINKLKQSLANAGADSATIDKISFDIENWAFDGVTSHEIFAKAFSILHRSTKAAATRYKLKKAIMELGPTGYPFEHFIGQLFEKQGYEIVVGVVVDGHCVTHEMDVVATLNRKQCLVECKYGRDQGKHVSVQVPLYVRSRVNDIIQLREKLPEYENFTFLGWIVTNTRFTEDSIKYGLCSGLHLLAWDYPKGNGLKDLIEKFKLYPITILQQLSTEEKQELLNIGTVTCRQLLDNLKLLEPFNFNEKQLNNLLTELNGIC